MTRSEERRQRARSQRRQVLLLTIVWLVLVGEVSLVTVGGGALIATLVTVLFPLPPVQYAGRLHPLGLARLAGRLLADLAVSSVRLAAWAFRPRPAPRSGVIRVQLRSESDLYEVNVAELASVVPGTIIIDARRRTRTLYLHVFHLDDPADAAGLVEDTLALERRVVSAFGSRKELAALATPPEDRAEEGDAR